LDTSIIADGATVASRRFAPTGTISIIADCSGGIEPMFSLLFSATAQRPGRRQGPMVETNETFELRRPATKGFYSEGLMEQIAKERHPRSY